MACFNFPALATTLIVIFARTSLCQHGDEDNTIAFKPNKITWISSGRCAEANLCCPGRDSSCVVQRARPNEIIEDLSDIPCFCDFSCTNLGDCCSDFKSFCKVQDCQVTDWKDWTQCDNKCGLGAQSRERSILVPARNGGKECPPLVQKRGCRGRECVRKHQRVLNEESAMILPIEYGEKRKGSRSSDITRNLRLRYPEKIEKNKRPYCVQFNILRFTKACKESDNFRSIQKGQRVCVTCEMEAQRPRLDYRCVGTGSSPGGAPTKFISLREPSCYGKWEKLKETESCECPEGPSFIFV